MKPPLWPVPTATLFYLPPIRPVKDPSEAPRRPVDTPESIAWATRLGTALRELGELQHPDDVAHEGW